ALFRQTRDRARREQELSDELKSHMDAHVDDNIRAGMTRETARREALVALGGVTQTADAVRDLRTSWLDALWNDARYGIRQLRATPAFTIVAILSLAIGTGANITIFGFAIALLFKPIEARDPGQLIRIMG